MARAATSAWAGVIEFGGFPIPLRAYNLIASRSAQSFKSLCPCHQEPVVMPKRCPVDGNELSADQMLKGHQVSKGQIAVVPPEAVEQLKSAEATRTLEIKSLPMANTVPLGLATGHFRLVPDDKVPGSAQPANILWNGLIATERALMTEWIPRAGARDALVTILADSWGLNAHTLPYESELKEAPEWKPAENEQASAMFEAFAQTAGISFDAFHHSDYESSYEQRRAAAIDAALSGKPIETAAAPASKPAVDLMAAMSAAVAAKDAKKKPPAKKAKQPKVKQAA